MNNEKSYYGAYAVKHKRRRNLHRILIGLAAVVVFCTTYALILPAITLDSPDCGYEEHIHIENCYKTVKTLVCKKAQDENHIHSEECYEAEKELVCTKPEHIHTDECYQKDSTDSEEDGTAPSSVEETTQAQENTAVSEEQEMTTPTEEETTTEPTTEADDKDKSDRKKKDVSESGVKDGKAYTDLEEYLASIGGEISYTLYDKNNQSAYTYNASGGGYTFTLTVKSPNGILPDSYSYKLPKELKSVKEQYLTGKIAKQGGSQGEASSIGTYEVTPDLDYIIFKFDEEANRYQNVVGRISLMVDFEEAVKQSLTKSGYYIADDGAMDGYMHFEIKAIIPKHREDAPLRQWSIQDQSKVTSTWVYEFDKDTTEATIRYFDDKSQTIATEDLKCLDDVYNDSSVKVAYWLDPVSKSMYFVNRCNCEQEICYHNESGNCKSLISLAGNKYPGWCTCWNSENNAEIIVKYKNNIDGATGENIFDNQRQIYDDINGGSTLKYRNEATLLNEFINENGKYICGKNTDDVSVGYSYFMTKHEIKHATEDNGFISTFSVVINEDLADFSKLDLDNDGRVDTEIVLTDAMSSMKYVLGSMSITKYDGTKETELPPSDYSVKVQGDDIVIRIRDLGRYRYTLTYRTMIDKPVSGDTVTLSNTVKMKSFYYRYSREFRYEDEWDYKRYVVNVVKVDYHDNTILLEGAEYGLYSYDDVLIDSQKTDDKGSCMFETNVEKGIIYEENKLYYIKEISPPKGYSLDSAKHWFYFSESQNTALEQTVTKTQPNDDITLILPASDDNYVGDLRLTDEELFSLPETGGEGTGPYRVIGVLLLAFGVGCIAYAVKRRKEYFDG